MTHPIESPNLPSESLAGLAEIVHQTFEVRTRARDQALTQARTLTRYSAQAIRAIHRNEVDNALQFIDSARNLVAQMKSVLQVYPDLYYAGYTQDAIKEYAEATLTFALIQNQQLPMPQDLEIEVATYICGLSEAAGELRRRCLDILRQGYSEEAERLLMCMDDIYSLLVTLDYPEAITNGLKRLTDVTRGVVERTRGDLTISLRQHHLEQALQAFSEKPATA